MARRRGPHRGVMSIERAKDAGNTLKRLWQYLGNEAVRLVIVLFMIVLSSGLSLAGPFLMGKAIDDYITPRDFSGLMKISLLMLGVYLLAAFVFWLQAYIMTTAAQGTVHKLRKDLFGKLQILPLSFFDGTSRGELISRFTNDIDNISNVLNQSFIQFLSGVLTVIGALIIMFKLNVFLTLVSLLIIPVVILVTGKISENTRTYFLRQQKVLGELNGYIEESVSGLKEIKVFCREEESSKKFNEINANLKDVGTRAQIFSGFIPPVMLVINNLGYALIAGFSGWLAIREIISIGVIVSFLNYIRQFTRPINQLANQFNMIQSAVAGAERVFEIMDEESEYPDIITGEINQMKGKVVFENVYFCYEKDVPILKNINFWAKPGDMIALVGPTGAGKTTIVNLIARFYEINSGSIKIDNKDIRDINKNDLRKQLGIVLQDAHLFSGTIKENIRYGKLDASDDEVIKTSKLANADGFINRLPNGYDTVLTAEGKNLSQGQRQLITIARAILANPSILILDEATSSVDTRTEMHIQEAMETLMESRTSFVIAHRLSTIRGADMILVVNGGEIIERGTHEELLKYKGFYYDLFTSQFRSAI